VGHSPSNLNVNVRVRLPIHHVNFRPGAYREVNEPSVGRSIRVIRVSQLDRRGCVLTYFHMVSLL
jgi:hypothetical protein